MKKMEKTTRFARKMLAVAAGMPRAADAARACP